MDATQNTAPAILDAAQLDSAESIEDAGFVSKHSCSNPAAMTATLVGWGLAAYVGDGLLELTQAGLDTVERTINSQIHGR
jgi:hypothetical protein